MNNIKKLMRAAIRLEAYSSEWWDHIVTATLLTIVFVFTDCASLFSAVDLIAPAQIPFLSWTISIVYSLLLCLLPSIISLMLRAYLGEKFDGDDRRKKASIIVFVLAVLVDVLALFLQLWVRIEATANATADTLVNTLGHAVSNVDITGSVFLGGIPIIINVTVFLLVFYRTSPSHVEANKKNRELKKAFLNIGIESTLKSLGDRDVFVASLNNFERNQYLSEIQRLEAERSRREALAHLELAKAYSFDGDQIHTNVENSFSGGKNIIPDMEKEDWKGERNEE